MAILNQGVAERLQVVIDFSKTVFHYGFIPTILYLGFSKGAEPGTPEITFANILW